MNKYLLTPLVAVFAATAYLQPLKAQVIETIPKGVDSTYRATTTKVNDLVHTKLDVRFDYAKRYLYGKEWITLKPQFYPTDSLTLDAKGMDIKTVALVNGKSNTPLKYIYDNELLHIKLNRQYSNAEKYTIYIEYTAKPDALKVKGSAAITDAKGLYFINPDGTEKDKPTQIWTQGETESNSVWFPTIDKPNQKTTEEISMTVPAKYTTLSNGKLTAQKKNADGTRTDTWKMEQPHSPYLFMMAVGDFKIYKDTPWRGKEISYYLEPKYAPYAKQIFGKTPDMISFYSKTLGVDFPWVKYGQIVVRDYVSGAMENTTATLHGEQVQKTGRELLDGNQEGTIAHELFHQWFGDYVTAESWSNLTMNESFATFGEVIWRGHDKGKEAEDRSRYEKLTSYLRGTKNGISPALARYYYNDKEEVFDAVTYSKGSIILYALKNLLGDAAFYKGLQKYLQDNAYKNGEPQQLRLALEAVSGRDLSQYFNQWWYYGGHPILDVKYDYSNGKATVHVKQIQDPSVQTFLLPVKLDYYIGKNKITKSILINKREQDFSFDLTGKPDFVDFDVDKIIVGEIKEDKTVDDYAFQYKNAPSFANRINALNFVRKDKSPKAQQLLAAMLKDPDAEIRAISIESIDLTNAEIKNAVLPAILTIAKTDKETTARAAAITKLALTGNAAYIPLMEAGIHDQSYNVIGASLAGLTKLAPEKGAAAIKQMDADTKAHIQRPLFEFYSTDAKDEYQSHFSEALAAATRPNKAYPIIGPYVGYLFKNPNPAITEKGLADLAAAAKRLKIENLFTAQLIPAYENMSAAKTQAAAKASSTAKDALLKQAELFKKAAEAFKK
ncbi:M1 family metallopeptidase [Niabella soli]|uniref:Aminopeptidase N n=1 Tax=Niabella soli DSM 19437 TaxID=929713 RepID=W0ETD6_9BACT|nr:M1 family metallopeptidase [Niabella soli]AHF14032.1 glutamyl aminopeptidase [Niabella soli DSM 19437]